MKKIYILLLALISAGTMFANGVCIDGLYYVLDKDRLTATVTYKSKVRYDYNKGWDITTAIIPETVNYKGKDYRVTSIDDYAFANCRSLSSVIIPDGVKTINHGVFRYCSALTSIVIPKSVNHIGGYAFYFCGKLASIDLPENVWMGGDDMFYCCSSLTSIIIPNGVKSIGYCSFSYCKNLTSIIIPESVEKIGRGAFSDCPNLTIYTASNAVNSENTNSCPYVKMSQETLMYYYPFTTFAKAYVENGINEWQKKGEFERIADWQKRVTESARQQKINDLLAEVQDQYCAFHAKMMKLDLTLGKYDAENEVFAMTDPKYGTMYIAVPFDEAPAFKEKWNAKKVTPQMQVYDDEVKLSALTIAMPNGKQYTYRNTDAVNYKLTEMTYNFEPVEFDMPKTSTAPKQGQVNITKTTVKIGKSAVDTDIPETNASNPNTFVIIFANEDYKNVASVPFAKNDGTVFQKYCQKTLGIPTNNIHYVENATFNDMRIQLAWLKDVCDAFEGNAAVIVYYAGHGIPDEASKSAYLLPIDGDGRYVQSAYKLDDLYQKLGAMRARSVTVFMDACFSGSKREDGMLASARGVAIKAKSGVPQGKMVVFSAASGDETAYPNTDEQHGMFTYYLLKKLQDTKGDVTLQELGTYITTNVRQQSIVKNGKSQTPTVTPSSDAADWQNWKLK